jgi:hypothetical protein
MWDRGPAVSVQWPGVVKDRLPRPSQALRHSVEVEHISLSFDYEKLILYNFSIDSPVSIVCTKHVL